MDVTSAQHSRLMATPHPAQVALPAASQLLPAPYSILSWCAGSWLPICFLFGVQGSPGGAECATSIASAVLTPVWAKKHLLSCDSSLQRLLRRPIRLHGGAGKLARNSALKGFVTSIKFLQLCLLALKAIQALSA